MKEKFECIVYQKEASLVDILLLGKGEVGMSVRQYGECSRVPPDAEIIESSGFMPQDRLIRWIRDYQRGYTDYGAYVKGQISWRDWRRLKRLRVVLDSGILADLWSDFIDFDKRRLREIPFLLSRLEEYAGPKVFDTCLGSGATTIGLKLAGVDGIISNDIDHDLITIAQKEARRNNISLSVTSYDWRELSSVYSETFNVVLCLGNSLTYLFRKEDQQKVVENFRAILRKNGKLIIDERNYRLHTIKQY